MQAWPSAMSVPLSSGFFASARRHEAMRFLGSREAPADIFDNMPV